MDAITGKVRFRDETLKIVAGHGQSLYVGKADLQTAVQGTSFLLKGLTRGGGYTVDAGNSTGECSLWRRDAAVRSPRCSSRTRRTPGATAR